MASVRPQSPVIQALSAKRRRLNQIRDVGSGCRITKAQFMSQPLAAFIDSEDESHFDIAKKIVTFFNDRDSGSYGAIVAIADEADSIDWTFNHIEEKFREVTGCRGKYICVWKQSESVESGTNHDEIAMRAVAKGLVRETKGDTAKVHQYMENVLGEGWCVVKHVSKDEAQPYFKYRKGYYFRFKLLKNKWTFWKTPS